MSEQPREQWSSSWGFLLAAAGSAIGLGNIWKFPYITGMNGGGVFVLIYLVCIAMIGLPIMLCELSLGRATGKNPIGAFRAVSRGRSLTAELIGAGMVIVGISLLIFKSYGYGLLLIVSGAAVLRYGWVCVGILTGGIIPVLIMAYYGVIGGWTLMYVAKSFCGQVTFVTSRAAVEVFRPIADIEGNNLYYVVAAQVFFMGLCGAVLWFGVRRGIERWSKILMPMMFVLLLVLILRSISLPGASAGVKFFLAPDWTQVTTKGVLTALGHAFFTLSLAMGIMISYGSYLRSDQNLVRSAFVIIGLDTLAAIMGGLAIFPAVFAMNFEPGAGPGLVYQILPAAFNQIPGGFGWLWNGLFFIALSIAALTSGISLTEVAVSVGCEQFKLSRHVSVMAVCSLITVLGAFCAASMINWNHLPSAVPAFLGMVLPHVPGSLFELTDVFCSDYLLPVGGVATALFVGWIWGMRGAVSELRKGVHDNALDTNFFVLLSGLQGEEHYGEATRHVLTPASFWGFFVRWVTPFLVLVAFLNGIGAF